MVLLPIAKEEDYVSTNSNLIFRGYSSFAHNTAKNGGGIYMKSSTLDVVETLSFQQNRAYILRQKVEVYT